MAKLLFPAYWVRGEGATPIAVYFEANLSFTLLVISKSCSSLPEQIFQTQNKHNYKTTTKKTNKKKLMYTQPTTHSYNTHY